MALKQRKVIKLVSVSRMPSAMQESRENGIAQTKETRASRPTATTSTAGQWIASGLTWLTCRGTDVTTFASTLIPATLWLSPTSKTTSPSVNWPATTLTSWPGDAILVSVEDNAVTCHDIMSRFTYLTVHFNALFLSKNNHVLKLNHSPHYITVVIWLHFSVKTTT